MSLLGCDRTSIAPEREFWRTLDERGAVGRAVEAEVDEFPGGLARFAATARAPSRRQFMRWMSASLAIGGAGLAGCIRQPPEEIVPFARQPQGIVPGKPAYYATAFAMHGVGQGVLVESHMGRPTKIEGNPLHPSVPPCSAQPDGPMRFGACDIFAQASVLSLYDPNRAQTVTRRGHVGTWGELFAALEERMRVHRDRDGAGLHLLTETITSPTQAALLESLLKQHPGAVWRQWEPCNWDNRREGMAWVFPEAPNLAPQYDLSRADVILSLDADFLAAGPGHLRMARQFAARRSVDYIEQRQVDRRLRPNRLYVVECTPSITGASADHALRVAPHALVDAVIELARRLDVDIGGDARDAASDVPRRWRTWLDALAADLQSCRDRPDGGAVVIAGPYQPPVVHALAHAMNALLGAVERGLCRYIRSPEDRPQHQGDSLQALVAAMKDRQVESLVILGGDPAHTAPVDHGLAELIAEVPFSLHVSTERNATSRQCAWHGPEHHYLESWGDVRGEDGTVSIVQPLIAPLYDTRAANEVVAAMLGDRSSSMLALVRGHWRRMRPELSEAAFEEFWRQSLHDGVVADTAFAAQQPQRSPKLNERIGEALSLRSTERPPEKSPSAATIDVDVVFRPDPTVCDGRFASNAWLQELPKPLSKLTWGNPARIGPALADLLGLSNEDVIELRRGKRSLRLPVWILPGQPEKTVTLSLGYGQVFDDEALGFDVNVLRTSDTPWHATATVAKTNERCPLSCTAIHHSMDGRDLIRSGTFAEVNTHSDRPSLMHNAAAKEHASFYPAHAYDDYKWGMAIKLGACIGCNACVVACQAENNIPVVGKNEVRRGREMHWLRVDRYHRGSPEQPETFFQPVPCMQCENAPCEPVCPVAATVHSAEGLNDMVYNRCVGTRYCSNNCPYKVRRFNYLQYSPKDSPVLDLLHNPDVTVRDVGVMEKCTYCVQRINAARIAASKEDRRIRDGDVVTACQAACPTEAIVFGDLNDPQSRVRRLKESPLDYALLAELNTRPRTTYQTCLRNPNPDLDGTAEHRLDRRS